MGSHQEKERRKGDIRSERKANAQNHHRRRETEGEEEERNGEVGA